MPYYNGLDGMTAATPALVARTLARVPRWNGQTIRPWSVLQHSLAVAQLAQRTEATEEATLYALWHDAEEGVVGDTPMPFKTPAQAAFGDEVRQMLYRETLKLSYPAEAVLESVKALDTRMRYAEAHALIHPRYSHTKPLDLEDVDLVYDLLDVSHDEMFSRFEILTYQLLGTPRMKALARAR